MRLLTFSSAALLLACLAGPAVHANPWFVYPPIAPDACGPGWYNSHPCGMVYGPHHYVRPCWEPFNGILPGRGAPPQQGVPKFPTIADIPAPPPPPGAAPQGVTAPQGLGMAPMPGYGPAAPQGQGLPPSPVFPTHPYARSPRDFFMLD
jgi:hypothetical protein